MKKYSISGIIGFVIIVAFMVSYYFDSQQSSVCGGGASCFIGKVSRVIDGDTIVVDDINVRLALTATPELDATYGMEAKEFTESICPVGSEALVDEDDGQIDGSYGRLIGLVKCGDVVLNSILLDKGLGIIDTRFCSVSEFSNTEWARKYGCYWYKEK